MSKEVIDETTYSERELEDDYPLRPGFLYVVGGKVWRCPPIARTLTAREVRDAVDKSVKNCDIKGRDIWHLAI